MGTPGIPLVSPQHLVIPLGGSPLDAAGCSWETISVWWPLPIRRAKLLKLLTARPLGPGTSVSKFGKANTEYLGMRTETY